MITLVYYRQNQEINNQLSPSKSGRSAFFLCSNLPPFATDIIWNLFLAETQAFLIKAGSIDLIKSSIISFSSLIVEGLVRYTCFMTQPQKKQLRGLQPGLFAGHVTSVFKEITLPSKWSARNLRLLDVVLHILRVIWIKFQLKGPHNLDKTLYSTIFVNYLQLIRRKGTVGCNCRHTKISGFFQHFQNFYQMSKHHEGKEERLSISIKCKYVKLASTFVRIKKNTLYYVN